MSNIQIQSRADIILYVFWTQSYKHFQHKFYATLIFKHSDWLLKFVNQSGCLKN